MTDRAFFGPLLLTLRFIGLIGISELSPTRSVLRRTKCPRHPARERMGISSKWPPDSPVFRAIAKAESVLVPVLVEGPGAGVSGASEFDPREGALSNGPAGFPHS